MQFDRRQFLWLSAGGALAAAGCCKKPIQIPGSAPSSALGPGRVISPEGPSLQIDFEGLYLLEQKDHSMVVHLIDAPAIDSKFPPHFPRLDVVADPKVVGPGTTAQPSSTSQEGSDLHWQFDLKGVNVTTPPSDTGDADLRLVESSIHDGEEIPSDECGWSSLARVPDLKVLCGATRVELASSSKFLSSITLNHGLIRALMPAGVGATAVWNCTDSAGNQLMRRAFSDRVRYSCPNPKLESSNPEKALTIQVGSQAIVFQPGVLASVVVKNLPAPTTERPPCPSPCNPRMEHFSSLFQLVDMKFMSTISLAAFYPPDNQDVVPDYCPGGRIRTK